MEGPVLKIARASAGSGKTHLLSLEFLKILSRSSPSLEHLKAIMATTFTNKAAWEMKERIINLLKEMALETEKGRELSRQLGFPSRLARDWLELILDNYTSFNVRTIDSFIYLLVRALSINLGINPDAEVLFEPDYLLEMAFERAASRDQKLLMDLLESFLTLEERRGFNVEFFIKHRLKEIKEQKDIFGGDRKLLDLSEEHSEVEKEWWRFVDGLKRVVEEEGLGDLLVKDCWKLEGLIDRFKKGAFLNTKKTRRKDPEKVERVESFFEKGRALAEEFSLYHSRKVVKPYSKFLRFLEEEMEEISKEQGYILGTNWARMVREALRKEPVDPSYALAKLGYLIEHFLIDEFQDTNTSQWEAMKPLVEEALSKGGTLFVVGDSKQSIYGWRGGDWSLLEDMGKDTFPMVSRVEEERLEENRRSAGNIVKFNNTLFEELKKNMPKQSQKVFGSVRQEWSREEIGRVEVYLVDADSCEEALVSRVKKAWEDGEDVAVLARKRSTVEDLAAILMDLGVPVVTENSLKVKSSPTVKGAISLLSYLSNTTLTTYLYGFLKSPLFQGDLGAIEGRIMEGFGVEEALRETHVDTWEKIRELREEALRRSPYELARRIYELFGGRLEEHERSFLMRLLEWVFHLEERYPTLSLMVEALKRESSWSVGLPGKLDAVKVMTVHKSKGLGFESVAVLVDGSWDVNKGLVRFYVDGSEVFYVGNSGRLLGKAEDMKMRLVEKERMEAFNLLYVALTRAIKNLYIFSVKPKKGRGKEISTILYKTLSDLRDKLGKVEGVIYA